jgi:hypothetical protein
MSWKTNCLLLAVVVTVAGCGTTQAPVSAVTAPTAPVAKSTTAAAAAAPKAAAVANPKVAATNITGTVAPGSKFSKIKLGMQFEQVNDLIGTPNGLNRNETGKRWIPFYFGSDVVRLQASYKGEGCLTYTGGNQFGSSGGELIAITVDPAGCI